MKKRYGKTQVMINSHFAQISNIPMTFYKAASLREFCDCTEKHLHAESDMVAMGEKVNII